MRVTVDSNIVVSAFLWGGNPRRVLNSARSGAITVFTSAPLIAELADVLFRRRFEQRIVEVGSSADRMLDEYKALANFVDAPDLPTAINRDPDDDAVLACALASESDVIVSGDKDLLDLNQYMNIRILTAAELLSELGL